MNDERFHELLEAHADETLDDEASRELLMAFAADAHLKARFLDELRLQNSLRGLPLLDEAERRVNDVMQSILPSKTSHDVSAEVLSALRPSKPRMRWYAVVQRAAAIAAVRRERQGASGWCGAVKFASIARSWHAPSRLRRRCASSAHT